MTSLYTDEVKQIVHAFPLPPGMLADIVEYDLYLGFRLYRDNFETFDGEQKKFASEQIQRIFSSVRGMGCPFYLEVVAGNGTRLAD